MQTAAAILDFLAALMLVMLPAALLFWLLIHPFAGFWRRLGPVPSYAIVGLLCVGFGYAIWTQRGQLMEVHWGYHPLSIGLGVLVYLVGAVWDIKVQRKLKFPILAGLPELSDRRPSRLLTDGPYARVRHPRYVAVVIGIAGFALIVNYPAVYAAFLLTIPVGYLLVVLEERELRERFGAEYEEYCARVPRFVPRSSRAARKG